MDTDSEAIAAPNGRPIRGSVVADYRLKTTDYRRDSTCIPDGVLLRCYYGFAGYGTLSGGETIMADDRGPGIYWVPSEKTEFDITWLMGRHLAAIEKMDWSWFFRLDDGSVIATESTWRIVTPQGVVRTSEDHDQQFGHPAPVDAAAAARKEIGGLAVTACNLDSRTGDLNLEFGSVSLQFLCLSGGYESWMITHGTQNLVCTGGGKIVEFIPE